ncbi:MAG: guanylate kinase [Candidatus Eisenbacteria bacterium]|nr:guanylate kinase [Candidatus Latescibacterota bacterium]MBD3302830.1 guanylate kinase [Candidatus Eisenbacteria bacterium]
MNAESLPPGGRIEVWTEAGAGFPLVVSGPSGVGKTSLVDRLLALDRGTVRAITATTRPKREGEIEGESYHFFSEERFLQLRDRGEVVESARYNDAWYGTPRADLERNLAAGRCVVLNIEVQGAVQIRTRYPEAVLVFAIPPSWEALRDRLVRRGTDTPEAIEARIRRGREEMEEIDRYDYVVVNDDLERCAGDLAAIVRAERRRLDRIRGRRKSDGEDRR